MFFCVKKRPLTKNSTKVFDTNNTLSMKYLQQNRAFKRKKVIKKVIFFTKKFAQTKKSFKFALA
jgi:hypothetical protein